jgi:hypothetical protein
MNLVRYKERVMRLLGRKPATFREVADKEWTIAPATHSTVPPAIFSESDLARVTGVMSDTTLDYELGRVRGGQREHGATTAFQISNVKLRDGYFLKGPWSYRLLKDPKSSPGTAPALHLAEASIGCSLFGNTYFGHWMTDDLTLTLAGRELAPPLAIHRRIYSHEPGYRALFGIETTLADRANIDRFVMLEDFGQNHSKAERYRTMRDSLRAACPTPGVNSRVYLRRGASGVPRILVNTGEVEACLASRGFLIVDPEQHSPAEIARLTNGARIGISVEGSHMIHGFVNLAEGGTICQIQPPYRFNNVFKDYADCLGMQYAFTVGLPVEGGFTLPIPELERFLDRVESASAASESIP